MAQSLGVFPAGDDDSDDECVITTFDYRPSNSSPQYRTFSQAKGSLRNRPRTKTGSPTKRPAGPKKHPENVSIKATGASQRARAESSPIEVARKASLDQRPESTPLAQSEAARSRSFGPSSTLLGALGSTRPRHIPIVIPEYAILTGESSTPTSTSLSASISNRRVCAHRSAVLPDANSLCYIADANDDPMTGRNRKGAERRTLGGHRHGEWMALGRWSVSSVAQRR